MNTFTLEGIEGSIRRGIGEYSNKPSIYFFWNNVKAEYDIYDDSIYLVNFEKSKEAKKGDGYTLFCFTLNYIKENLKHITYVTLLSLPTTRNKNIKLNEKVIQEKLNSYYKSLGFNYNGDPTFHSFKADINTLIEKCSVKTAKKGGRRNKTLRLKKEKKVFYL